MKRSAQAGFTLLELLVGMAILGVVMMALLNYFTQGTRISTQSSSRAESQQEILNAQQLIAGKLKEAWYVYPSGQAIALTSTNAPISRNPITDNQNWTTGTYPMLAMILPPKNSSATCASSSDGCYRFLAYYPVKRSVWVGGTASSSWRNPGPDDTNGDTWILAEYRATMPSTFAPGTFPPTAVPTVPTTGEANILSDYIAPTVATPGFTTASNTYTMFAYTTATWSGTSSSYVNSVTINLATTRKIGGTTLRLPNATDEYSITVYPTNLGKTAAN